jgi:hypothetical protein
MRLLHALLLLPLLGGPVFAQSGGAPDAEHHARRSAQQHFSDANITHDGRLTLDQATANYKSIAKSFQQIDVNRHGYVTFDDIKAWKAAKKAAKQAAKQAAGDAASDAADGIVRPTPAVLRGSAPTAVDASTGVKNAIDLPSAPLDGKRPY